MKTKITSQEAWALIASYKQSRTSESIAVSDAVGCRLARDIYSPIALPPFHNSAVDGFALGSLASEFSVIATIGAGDSFAGKLDFGQACRIMTGAQIPAGTVAVAMQEFVMVQGNQIRLESPVKTNDHIRWAGEDVDKGILVAKKGTRVGAVQVGLFSALGILDVLVEVKPTVAIVSTGSELIDPGQSLKDGQVYYCTGPMLSAQCQAAGARVLSVQKVADDPQIIHNALKNALAADIIITIGGMADGEYDYGRSALTDIGVEPVFYEGQWRPGKPLFFGKLGEKLVFGLPGNPVAAFVMFRTFVETAISGFEPEWRYAPIVGVQPKILDKAQFLRARHTRSRLELVAGQGSHQLYSLSLADAIVFVPAFESQREDYAYIPVET